VNALRVSRTRPVISAVNPATSPVIATTQLLRVPDVVPVEEDSTLVVEVEDPKSATSAPRSVTLPATALRLVATEEVVVDMEPNKVDMVGDSVVVEAVAEDKPAILVVVTDTCPATAPKAKSATTAVRSVIFPETAHPRLAASVLATSASNPDTFRLNARTKPSLIRQEYNEDLRALRDE